MSRLAILDLGTNTFHLVICSMEDRGYEILHKEKIPVKIGSGGISQGFISSSACARALKAVRLFKALIDQYDASEIHAFATSAIRNASNGKAFLDEVKQQSGIKVRILSGDEEAQYIYLGVRQAVAMDGRPSLIMDIGGGSVEFVIGNSHTILWKKSYEIGAQRLLDKFHKHDPVHPGDLIRLNHYLDNELKTLFVAAGKYHPVCLIGSSGTFDTLSDIYSIRHQILKDPAKTERLLPIEDFLDIHGEVIHMNHDQRLAIPGMIEMRADMFVMSAALIRVVLSRLGITQIKTSSFSLKEGVLQSMAELRQRKKLSA
jgi:exopolyphosphatase/guanosine-5'-triphosphate,3'-diphosphate pyrophosphatase